MNLAPTFTVLIIERQIVAEGRTVIVLVYMDLPRYMRGKGIGTKVMQALCEYADKKRLPIRLEAGGMMDSDHKRLMPFYERFGFVAMVKYDLSILRSVNTVPMVRMAAKQITSC
jgi:GNAT superfamily N-acetyltransferase